MTYIITDDLFLVEYVRNTVHQKIAIEWLLK